MSINYQLLRSRRRNTLAIQVREGQVIVRAPIRVSQSSIDAFVRSRQAWIRQHLQRQQQAMDELGVRIEQGGCIPWQGQMLSLTWHRGHPGTVVLMDDEVHVQLSPRVRREEAEAVASSLKDWFRQQAQGRLTVRARELAALTGLVPASVDIGSWRARWGQCSSLGEVKLNWRLLQLRPVLQDYVILHELCHLRHMHHGAEFQRLLTRHCTEHIRLRSEMARYTPWLNW